MKMMNLNMNDTTNLKLGKPARRSRPAASPSRAVTSMLLEVATDLTDWKAAAGAPFPDVFAGWTAPQYLFAARQELAEMSKNSDRLKLLREMARDAVALQRGHYWSPRLQLDRERLDLEQQKRQDALTAAQPKPQNFRDPKLPLSDEDRRAIVDKVDEIMGLK